MRRDLIVVLSVILFVISACDRPEEILPAKPAARDSVVATTKTTTTTTTPTAVPKTEIAKPSLPILKGDSASYLYGNSPTLPYRILFPKNYDPKKTYSLLMFLHGVSERGTDNEKQLLWGSSLFLNDSIRNKYSAIIVFPQCPITNSWVDPSSTQALKQLLDILTSAYSIHKNRIYIGGLSMGGYGTYAMVAQYPETFAAAVAISGDGDEHKASIMSKTKWRIFAGKKDLVVVSSKSEKMVNALQKSGASVLFKEYPDADHVGSWVKAFAEPDFCSWLFSVSRK
jgi:predicted peptidase